jgi:hypothetical protein
LKPTTFSNYHSQIVNNSNVATPPPISMPVTIGKKIGRITDPLVQTPIDVPDTGGQLTDSPGQERVPVPLAGAALFV